MVRKILSAGKTPFDNLLDSTIANSIAQLGDYDKLRDGYTFSYEEKWRLYDSLQVFLRKSGPIKLAEAFEMTRRFSALSHIGPNSFNFNKTDFDDFFTLLDDLRPYMPDPDNNEIGFRMYIGYHYEGPVGIVIIPMYGPKPDSTGTVDRTKEKEYSFFNNARKAFFALLGQGKFNKATLSKSQETCAAAIGVKDQIGKQLAHYTEKDFLEFIQPFRTQIETMRVTLARTDENLITTIISFYDVDGVPLQSGDADAIFFDQANLIPPPPSGFNVPDSFFIR